MYIRVIKPMFDISIAIIVFVITSPIFILVSILLFIANSGSVFFIQLRPGYKSIPIGIIKFKTMDDRRDSNGVLLPNSLRITKIGRLLRKSSIDELPQLINVIKGDMSLVGPRPLLFKYLSHYSKEQLRRHNVKPGITGWAQVNGRQAISFEKRFELDVWYVDNVSFILDLKIFFLTLFKIFRAKGIEIDQKAWRE